MNIMNVPRTRHVHMPCTHGTPSPYSLSHQLLPDRPAHHSLCKKTQIK